jgi:hypothetical protein
MASTKPKDKKLNIVSRPLRLTTDATGLVALDSANRRYRRFSSYGIENLFSKVEDIELMEFVDLPGAGLWLLEEDHRFLRRLLAKLKTKQSQPA